MSTINGGYAMRSKWMRLYGEAETPVAWRDVGARFTGDRLENLELWSTSQPSGKRVEDLLEYAQLLLDRYGEEFDLIARTD